MPDREKVIRGLRDIDMFIAGRLGYEKAKNFLRTIDEIIMLLKEQEEKTADIRDVDGLWCDDITFCQETCERMDCPRN